MEMQALWSRLTVRELAQHFHEPRQRRLRHYLAATRFYECIFVFRLPQCDRQSLQVMLSAGERYADGLATAIELRGARRMLAEFEEDLRHRDRQLIESGNAIPVMPWYVYEYTPVSDLQIILSRRITFESALRVLDATGRLFDQFRVVAHRSVAEVANEDWLDPRFLDMAGNADRATAVQSRWLAWNHGTIPAIARGIYEERAFHDLPILADALEDAGCTSRDILDHCRGPRPHVRGCWVVDLLLENT
jgi:hypothetical protein